MSSTHPLDTRRQPKPVFVTLESDDPIDAVTWLRDFVSFASRKGDSVEQITGKGNVLSFRIFPRAVND